MKVLFLGSVGLITRNRAEARRFFVDALGLPLQGAGESDFLYTGKLGGSKSFVVAPLSEVARLCFGSDSWPSARPVPHAFFEYEVGNAAGVARAASELVSKGYTLLHAPRKEPWGQTVVRLQTEDGTLIGISYAPSLHRRASRAGEPPATPRRR
jgi:catechol 2,3-dioxygenase-like lactoylglutathione lyase family enzyme